MNRRRMRNAACGWLLALGATAGCGDDDGLRPVPDAEADAGPVDARTDAGPRIDAPATPNLLPCPSRWTETRRAEQPVYCEPPAAPFVRGPCPAGWLRTEADGLETCEPWPDGGPVDWACPEGWSPVTIDSVTTCEPYAGAGPDACPPNAAHFPGEPGCVALGTACPDGRFPVDLPQDASVVFVDPSAPENGDGSRASPYRDLSAVPFDTLAEDAVIALATGTHDAALELNRSVRLRGACPAQTVLTASGPATILGGVLDVQGGIRRPTEVVVENLRIERAGRPAVTASGRTVGVVLRDVVIEDVSGVGVGAFVGARVELEGVILRDIGFGAGEIGGRALEASNDAVVSGVRVDVQGASGLGVLAITRATVRLEDSSLRDTRPFAVGDGGSGAYALEGSRVELRRSLVSGHQTLGLGALDAESELILEDVAVRDTGALPDGRLGLGVSAEGGGTARLVRVSLDRNGEVGVLSFGESSQVELEDVVVRDTRPEGARGEFGYGLAVEDGAMATASRLVVDGNGELGVSVQGDGSRLVLDRAWIRNTKSRPLARGGDGALGQGLSVKAGARVEASSVWFERNRDAAAIVTGPGSALQLTDVVISGTQASDAGAGGVGIAVQAGARVDARRVRLEGNREIGVFVDGSESQLSIEELVVRDTRPLLLDERFGRGLNVQGGAQAEVHGALLDANRDVGIFVEGARLALEDVFVRRTRPEQDRGLQGIGLLAQEGAWVQVRRGVFADQDGAAALIRDPGTQASFEDVVVDHTMDPPVGERRGRGLTVQAGGRAEVRRLLVRNMRELSLAVIGESRMLLEDAIVRSGRSRAIGGVFGRGINVASRARLDAERVFVDEARDFGVVVETATAVISDLVVRQTLDPDCADRPTPCPATPSALGATRGGMVEVTRARLDRAGQCGVFIGDRAGVDLREVRIRDNPIGACVQNPSFDLSRLSRPDVIYEGNELLIELTSFPSPETPESVDARTSRSD